ncbi:PREG-like protein [Blastocystis sp. subtype 4]|uniref:PREG-like protein n=1 Tax=Blastocystis sp. subtype 4 TaxID=944170 RepID=UPI00071180CE|nr:PREG-like protein [Blastocystis sp. subtype 4]KNB44295.1 PREG-like protein [Blastocystis sp. subtype 4]|eukprot:XP_014527738.1 PREG-like protein [Blastocystis sp. subtype 4]
MDDEYGESLVKAYICVIKSLVSRCEDVAKSSHNSTSKFHSTRIPSISIDDYVESYECFVCSLAYIDLLLQNPGFVLNGYSVHRVVLTTVMEAAKFYDDSFFNNELYARVGGVSSLSFW